MSRFVFPQLVEKQVEKAKTLCDSNFFPLLKRTASFQHFLKRGIFAQHLRYIFSHQRFPVRSDFPHTFLVSTFFCTFFPFPHRIFSRISTSFPRASFFPQNEKVFRTSSPLQNHGKQNAKTLAPAVFLGLFQLFYTN